jgi:hypothetical protein
LCISKRNRVSPILLVNHYDAGKRGFKSSQYGAAGQILILGGFMGSSKLL